MKVVHLSKKKVLENINRLIEVDKVILDEPWTEDNFLIELKGKWEHSLVALVDTNIVGFVICSMKGENLHIHRIAVSPEYQGRGIGTLLVEHLFTNCDKHGIKYVTVKSKKINEKAQRFYERQAFKRIGTNGPNYVYKNEMK
jgi:ribosomal-protein-alanine N-acetyltransferase